MLTDNPKTAARALLALLALAACVRPAAADDAPGGFRAYPFRRASATDALPAVETVLAAVPEAEAVADPRGNRILVRGPDRAQQLAYEVVARLDADPAPGAQSGPTEEPVLRSYSAGGRDLSQVVDDLQRRYGGAPGVRIAPDLRTAQILVLAPEPLHNQIARLLVMQAPPSGIQAPAIVPPRTPALTAGQPQLPTQPQDSQVRTLQLRRMSPMDVEQSLARLWRDKLSRLATGNAEVASYRVALGDSGVLELHVDPRVGQVILRGPASTTALAAKLLEALDAPPAPNEATRVASVHNTSNDQIRHTIQLLETANRGSGPPPGAGQDPAATAIRNVRAREGVALAARLFQPREVVEGQGEPGGQPAANQPGPDQPPGEQPPADATLAPADDEGLVGPVQIEFLEGFDAIIVRGNQADVDRVLSIIEEIERLSTETQPVIEVYQLEHVGSLPLATTITQLYQQTLAARQGQVSITALVKPNALLLIGRAEAVASVKDLVQRLDQPVPPSSQFQVFRLKHAAADSTAALITQFFAAPEDDDQPQGLAPRVRVTADYRSNSLVVQASPRDLLEVGDLINQMDTPSSEAVNELRVFQLQHTLASDLAPVLQQAITGQGGTGAGVGGGGQQTLVPNLSQFGLGAAGQQGQTGAQKSTMLRFMTVDSEGKQQLNSGILLDVRVTAEPRGNAILVSAPTNSMELIAALVKYLDQPPAAVSQIKVFTIVNGDAGAMVQLLETLFGGASQTGQGGRIGAALQPSTPEGSIVQLRFSVDTRTNSIIAAGSAADLNIVEAIMLRLDESDIRERQTRVYRLKNAPANEVSTAINEFLQSERDVQEIVPGTLSAFEQIEREVVVVPEVVSNSLIVSATPRYYTEIARIVEELDARRPMVMVQVLIAEVAMNNTDEFGVELGLQDSVLFDRSLINNLELIDSSTTQAVAGGGTITANTQRIVSADNVPGFAFNGSTLGNSASDRALASSGRVGGQALSNLSVGRINSELGFGGLVLSAGSESINVLIRALQESRRVEILSRPQIMMLDEQYGAIQVGQTVSRVDNAQTNQFGQLLTAYTDVDVGIILGITPRISPDGLIVMNIEAIKSRLGPDAEGVPIAIANNGEVLRSPNIDRTAAQTTVSAYTGQTIVLGGLITKEKEDIHRRVPLLADIPVLGSLFRYDYASTRRTELLIIMTPTIVRNESDADLIRQQEVARMHWCLADVDAVYGGTGLRSQFDEWDESQTPVILPDIGVESGEALPPPVEVGPNLTPGVGAANGNRDERPAVRLAPAPNSVGYGPSAQPPPGMQQPPAMTAGWTASQQPPPAVGQAYYQQPVQPAPQQHPNQVMQAPYLQPVPR